ncbi:MAG: CARDB domain-containing protein, partial [Chitinophagales bacterium]
KDTGEMHRYNTWPQGYEKTYGSDSFIGGVFDGNRLWMIPFSADRVIALTDDIPVDYVYLNQGFLALLPGGESYTLKTSFLPENATNKQVTWSSDNPSVATVDDGVVTPVSEGTATITVTTVDGGKTRTCLVYVGNYADLSLGSPVMTPVPTMNAGKATIQVTITNRGLATSGISYITGMIYLKNGGWYEIFQNTKVSKIRPGKSKKMRIRVNIPDPVLTGEYTYRLTLEAEEGAYEATPGNLVEGTFANVASNLVVGSVAAEPRVSGKKTTVSAEVTNTGQGTAKNIETRFYLSTDAVLDSGDVVVGMKKISSLKAGQVKKLKFKTMLGTDPGYLIVKTDWSDSIMEDEESDNIGFYQLN